MSTIQHRYRAAARRVMDCAGGDPERADALAAWGQEVHQAGDVDARAVLARDGTIVVRARLNHGRVQVVYVTRDHDAQVLGVAGLEAGLAMSQIARVTGQNVILVTMSDLAWTPYRRTDRPREDQVNGA